MRKYNISSTVVLQSLAQIKAMYKDDYETIIGNCDTSILLGTQEQTTAEYFSKQLGKATIRARSTGRSRGGKNSHTMNYQQTGRELMTMDEIRTMSNDNCLVFVRGEKPFLDKKYVLENHPRYKFTGDFDDKYRFDLHTDDRFLNMSSEEYQKMAVEKEEPPEAEDVVSKTKDAAEVELGSGNSSNSEEKFNAISDPDRQSAAKYIAECNKQVNIAAKEAMRVKPAILSVMLLDVDYRLCAAFVAKLHRLYDRPAMLFCSGMKQGELFGYYIDPTETIEGILYDMGFKHIETLPEDKDEDFIIHRVKDVNIESYSALRDAFFSGKSVKDDLDDSFDELCRMIGGY